MEVDFGTKNYSNAVFKVSDYGTAMAGSTLIDDRMRAHDLLNKTMNDPTFIADHYRNEDAVNCCIALHVLGYDPCEWFDNFFDDSNISKMFYAHDIGNFMDHVHRICGYGVKYYKNYLLRWGPVGDEGAALGYAID